MTIGSMILIICLSFLFFYYFPYRALKVLGFIPYFFYKIFILRKLKWKSKAVITHRGWIEYMAKGNQNVVLLYIHGSPGGCDQTIDPGENFSVLTPSRPGYLGTDISSGRSPEMQAECYKALIDVMMIDQVFIMGVSGGGPSAMHFAAKYPKNTSGLILFEAVTHSQNFQEEDEELINSWDMDLFLRLAYMSFFNSNRLAAMMLPNKNNRSRLLSKKENIEKLKRTIWSIWPISARREGVKNDYEQFTRLNIPYESISAPTLIIHGDEDSNVNIEHAEFAKEKIKGSSLYIVKEGDHMMSATHAEEIEYQIESFISSHS